MRRATILRTTHARAKPWWAIALAFAVALAGCTGNEREDTDKDGDRVDDDVETGGTLIDIVLLTGTVRRNVTSDPTLKDTDGDGLLDSEELLVRLTDPRDVDTDSDGLLDGPDLVPPDDATRDAWRARGILHVNGTFLGELNACPPDGPQLRANVASSDLPFPDELLDGEELRGWDISVRGNVRHVTSDPCKPDTDGDGLLDHDELALLSDPRDRDTDGDGVLDGSDADPLWDLGLAFTDLAIEGVDSESVRIVFAMGAHTADLTWPGNGTATLDVPDATGDRESLEVTLTLRAEDRSTGQALALTPDGRGVILTFDLIRLTVGGAQADDDRLRFSGTDGSMSFTWSVSRR